MNLLWTVFELVVTSIDIAFFLLILIIQVGLKEGAKKEHILIYGLLFLVLAMAYNYFNQNSITSLFLTVTLLIVYASIFIHGKWIYKAFWIFFPMALLYSIEILVFAFLVHIHQEITIEVFALQSVYRLQLAFGAKTLQVFLFIFISRLKLHLEKLGYSCVSLLTISIVVSIAIMLSFELSEFVNQAYGQDLFFRVCTGFLFMNLLNLGFISIVNRKNKALSQKLVEQEVQLQRFRNYEQLAATHEKFKNYQESIDEVMGGIWDMGAMVHTKQGRARQIEQYQNLLFRIHLLKQNFNLSYCTGDEMLDVILSSKGDLALTKNIRILADVGRLTDLPYDSEVLGGILINLLDAAIETVAVIEDEDCEKAIALSCGVETDYLDIEIEYPANAWEGIREVHDVKRVSLQIARGLTEKIEGQFHTAFEEYYCTVSIKLPLYTGSRART
jgi:hypothetical protein